jgi:hypothetical protein
MMARARVVVGLAAVVGLFGCAEVKQTSERSVGSSESSVVTTAVEATTQSWICVGAQQEVLFTFDARETRRDVLRQIISERAESPDADVEQYWKEIERIVLDPSSDIDSVGDVRCGER